MVPVTNSMSAPALQLLLPSHAFPDKEGTKEKMKEGGRKSRRAGGMGVQEKWECRRSGRAEGVGFL